MPVVPSHFPVDIESVRYQALGRLSEWGNDYVEIKRLDSTKASNLLIKITQIRLLLKALDYSEFLTLEQRQKITYALIKASEIYQFPTAPVLANVNRPAILSGSGGGTTTVTNNYDAGTPFSNTDVDIGTETVDTFATSLASSVLWHYTATNGTAQRSGLFLSSWIGSSIDSFEDSSPDVGGSTSDLVLSADISAGAVRLRATAASNNWIVRGKRYLDQ